VPVPQLTGVPALCRQCGGFFSIVDIPPGVAMNISGLAHCPRCKGEADMFDGLWKLDVNGAAQLLEGPEWTKDRLIELYRVLQQAQVLAGQDPAAAAELIEDKAPTIAQRLKRVINTPAGVAAIGVIGMIVAAMIGAPVAPGPETVILNGDVTINEAPQPPGGGLGQVPPDGPTTPPQRP